VPDAARFPYTTPFRSRGDLRRRRTSAARGTGQGAGMSTRTETGRPAAEAAAPSRGLAWLYVIAGGIGLLASGALTLEKIARLRRAEEHTAELQSRENL